MYEFNEKNNSIVQIATRNLKRQITSMIDLNSNSFIIADKRGVIKILKKVENNNTQLDDCSKLISIGSFNIGEKITQIIKGSYLKKLINDNSNNKIIVNSGGNTKNENNKVEEDNNKIKQFLFSTESGQIGSMREISNEQFKLLNKVQSIIAPLLKRLGISSKIARNLKGNFIDGDLLITFLNLEQIDREKLLEKSQNLDIEEFLILLKKIEYLVLIK